MRVGLLGGSFNPAHSGHRHVADIARARLRLDQVWLMVSPANPLKPARGMAPLSDRLASAQAIGDGRHVLATDIEARLGTRHTVDTLARLRTRFPRASFVWLMGADNLVQFHRWGRWRDILRSVAAGVSGYMALSVPVVCAFAGATLINLPVRDREGLVSTLDSVSRPLYLVSLVIVGATWDIGLWQGWVLALVYAFARLLGALLGGLWAKHVEPEGLPSRAEFISALIPQSPVAVVVIVAASTAWVGERPQSVRWTITAVILGAVFVDILARPLRVALRRREVSP